MVKTAETQKEEQLEQQYLKGSKDPDLGVYCSICSAKTGIEGQNGGVVTSLLIKGLTEGMFDAVVVVKRTHGYNAEATATGDFKDILAAKGTKYLKVNVLNKICELAEQGKRRMAVTCTPCQARAVRNIQQTLRQKFPGLEITIIGLFCLEAFDAVKLKEQIKRVLNVDLDKAERTEIRKGKFYVYLDGQEFSCRIRELAEAAEKGCQFCGDFTCRFADVSVGGVGSEPGYSTVVVRSNVGEKLLKGMDANIAVVDVGEVVKLSKFKAERAQKRRLELENQR